MDRRHIEDPAQAFLDFIEFRIASKERQREIQQISRVKYLLETELAELRAIRTEFRRRFRI